MFYNSSIKVAYYYGLSGIVTNNRVIMTRLYHKWGPSGTEMVVKKRSLLYNMMHEYWIQMLIESGPMVTRSWGRRWAIWLSVSQCYGLLSKYQETARTAILHDLCIDLLKVIDLANGHRLERLAKLENRTARNRGDLFINVGHKVFKYVSLGLQHSY